jgi:hypothetical protein
MDDETEAWRARQAKEIDDLRETLERSREKVGVNPEELRSVFATAPPIQCLRLAGGARWSKRKSDVPLISPSRAASREVPARDRGISGSAVANARSG